MLFVAVLCIGSEMDVVHCVVDRSLITGQNEQSTLVAIQNVILACSLQYVSVHCFLGRLLLLCILYKILLPKST